MEKFKQALIDKYHHSDFEIIDYIKRTYPLTIKCLKCQQIITVDRANRLLDPTRKNICSKCMIKKSPTQQSTSIEFQHKFDYWYNSSGKNNYNILKPYKYYSVPIKLQCKKCDAVTNRNVKSLLEKPQCLCCELKCTILKTNKQFLQEVYDLEGKDYLFLEEYTGANVNIKVKHTCGFIYEVVPHHFLLGDQRCPKCCRNESKGERIVRRFLEQQCINYEPQKRFEDFKMYAYDFYIPEKDLLIEYNGIQHYLPVKQFGGESQLINQKRIDNKKQEYANSIGQLLTISYLDYNHINDILSNFFQNSTTIENHIIHELVE